MRRRDSKLTSRTEAGAQLTIEGRIRELELMLSAKKSIFDRTGAWAGMFSLAISIVTGSFTLYDRVVSKPKDDYERKINEFRTTIASISSVLQENAYKLNQVSDEGVKASLRMSANYQLLPLVRAAEQLEPQINSSARDDDYLVLGHAEGELQNHSLATRYLKIASLKAGPGMTRAEVYRLLAEAQAVGGTSNSISEARVSLGYAWKEVADSKEYGASFIRGKILDDYIVTETFFGDCTLVQNYISRLRDEMKHSDLTPDGRSFLFKYVVNATKGQNHCPLPEPQLKAISP